MKHLFIFGALLCPMLCAAAPVEATQQEIDRREKDGDHILQEESHQHQTAVRASTPNEIFQLRNDERFRELLEQFEVEEIRSLPGLNAPEESDTHDEGEGASGHAYIQKVLQQQESSQNHDAEESELEQYIPTVAKGGERKKVVIKLINADDGDTDDVIQGILKSKHQDTQIDTPDAVDGDLIKLIKNTLLQNKKSEEKLEISEKKSPSIVPILSTTKAKFMDVAEGVYLADHNGANKDVNIKVLYLGDPETDAFIGSVLQMDDVEALLQKHKFTVLKEVQDPMKDLQLETLDIQQLKKLVEESPPVKPTNVEQTHEVKIEHPIVQIQNSSEIVGDVLDEAAEIPQTTEKTDDGDLEMSDMQVVATTNVYETEKPDVGIIDVRSGGFETNSEATDPPEQKYTQIPTLRDLTAQGTSKSEKQEIRATKELSKDSSDGVSLEVLATANMRDITKLTERVNVLEALMGEFIANQTNKDKDTITHLNGESKEEESVTERLPISDESSLSSYTPQEELSHDPQLFKSNAVSNEEETLHLRYAHESSEELNHAPQITLANTEPSDEEILKASHGKSDLIVEKIPDESLINHESTQGEFNYDPQASVANTEYSQDETLNLSSSQKELLPNEHLTDIKYISEGSPINRESIQRSQPSNSSWKNDGNNEDLNNHEIHEEQQLAQQAIAKNTDTGHEETLLSSPSENEFTSMFHGDEETMALFYSLGQAAETSAEDVEDTRRTKRSHSSRADDVAVYPKPESAQCKEAFEVADSDEVDTEPATNNKEEGHPKIKKYVKKIELNAGKKAEINQSEAGRRKRAIYNTQPRDSSHYDNRLEGPTDPAHRLPTPAWLRFYSHPDEALRFEYQPIVRQTRDYEPMTFNPAHFRANRGYGFNEWGGLGLNP